MSAIQLNSPDARSLVVSLRWVMVTAVVLGVILTLCAQPPAFWHDSSKAIRGDGLALRDAANRTFLFFLERGAFPFVVAKGLYLALIFWIVTRLPGRPALLLVLTAIFVHGYGATNWLGTRFHLGVGLSPALCGTVLGVVLLASLQSTGTRIVPLSKRWRWLIPVTLLVDFINTLVGQPASYWLDPSTQYEGNILVRLFLGNGWFHFFALDLILGAGEFFVISLLPPGIGLICVFGLIFGNFSGATNWFFFAWQLGWIGPIAYSLVLSAVMAALALWRRSGDESTAIDTR